MIINIRGTSGSGKTTVVRGIMDKGVVTPLDSKPKPHGYRVTIPSLDLPVMVVGSYENTCGGTDGIKTQDEICDRIRRFAQDGHVLVEGLLMSKTFGRYAALDRELASTGHHFIWAFLDTPLDVCLARVEARRETRRLGKAVVPEYKPLNPANTTTAWHNTHGCYAKVIGGRESDWKTAKGWPRAKLDGRWLPFDKAVETVFQWLHE